MFYKIKLGGCLINVLLLHFQPHIGFKLDLKTQNHEILSEDLSLIYLFLDLEAEPKAFNFNYISMYLYHLISSLVYELLSFKV